MTTNVGRWLLLRAAASDLRLLVPLAVAAVAIVLVLAQDLSFHGDEWAFIVDRRLTADDLLRPHNEHLAAVHVLAYRALVEIFGIESYLPFLATLMAVHLATAAGLAALLSRYVAPLGVIGATTLFLFLGSGFDNLVWGFQIGSVGSVALGLWALVAANRPIVATSLLTLSIWTSSVGLFFVLPMAVVIQRRAWLLLPIGSYGAWLILIGRTAIPSPASADYVTYLLTLIGSGFAGVSGVALGAVEQPDPMIGLLVAAILFVALGLTFARGARPPTIVVIGLIGLLSEYAILTLGRAHFGSEQALAPRYVYVAAPFILMLLAGLRRLPGWFWAVAFVVALGSNLLALPRGVAIYQAFLSYDRSITLEERLAPFRVVRDP